MDGLAFVLSRRIKPWPLSGLILKMMPGLFIRIKRKRYTFKEYGKKDLNWVELPVPSEDLPGQYLKKLWKKTERLLEKRNIGILLLEKRIWELPFAYEMLKSRKFLCPLTGMDLITGFLPRILTEAEAVTGKNIEKLEIVLLFPEQVPPDEESRCFWSAFSSYVQTFIEYLAPRIGYLTLVGDSGFLPGDFLDRIYENYGLAVRRSGNLKGIQCDIIFNMDKEYGKTLEKKQSDDTTPLVYDVSGILTEEGPLPEVFSPFKAVSSSLSEVSLFRELKFHYGEIPAIEIFLEYFIQNTPMAKPYYFFEKSGIKRAELLQNNFNKLLISRKISRPGLFNGDQAVWDRK